MQPNPGRRVSPQLSRGQYDSFVVRVWSQSDGGLTHGRITHVRSRDTLAFRAVDELITFMLVHVGRPPRLDAELPSPADDS
jgi:hypothetical protein